MNKRNNTPRALFVIVFGLFWLSACTKHRDSTKPAPTTEAPTPTLRQTPFKKGELVVVAKNEKSLDTLRKKFEVETLSESQRVYKISGLSLLDNEPQVAKELLDDSVVQVAEPNYLVHTYTETGKRGVQSPVPRDPRWLQLWGLKNYGQDAPDGAEGKKSADIGALEAWGITKGNRDVVVAIIDTGIDYNHPDLRDNVWKNDAEISGMDGIDDDGDGWVDNKYGWDFCSGLREQLYHGKKGDPDPMDDNGHGTHVAGTIGGVGNNRTGVVGVNWQVRMVGLKFLNNGGSGAMGDAVRAFEYILDQIKHGRKIDVINASWGGGARNKVIEAMIRAVGEKGVLFVTAAGNDAENNDMRESFPANYKMETSMAVAATDNRDQLAGFSNFGYENVDIAAPGVAITSTFPLELARKTPNPEPYRTLSGTSMATPHVVGAAALVLAAEPNLRGKPAELKKRLLDSVEWLPQLAARVASGGRLNVARAVLGQNGTSPISQTGWVEESYSLETPFQPTEKIDRAWKIQKAGARSLQLHLASSMIDAPFDAAVLYDGLFRVITPLPAEAKDEWLPPVAGDTAYIKFSNGTVVISTPTKSVEVTDPTQAPGAKICWTSEPGKFTCQYYQDSKEFFNFGSEGVRIDRIRYLPEVKESRRQ